jgi:predicted amidohydrolase
MNPERFAKEYDEQGGVVSWMKDISKEYNAAIAGSVAVLENGEYFNRFLWVKDHDVQYYNKKHLFTLAGEDANYTAGESVITPEVKGWKIRPLICYDLRFPVWSRNHWQEGTAEFDALIYSANWPEPRIEAWKKLLMARAIENQVYTLGVNRVGVDQNNTRYTGNSMFVDPYGMPIADLEDIRGLTTVTYSRSLLDNFRSKFPFLQDGN